MLKKVFFPVALLILAYALWASADFMEIAAGVALFMFGMICLQDGFKAFTGGALEAVLRRSTDRLWKSLTFGMVSTSIMQSSTLVSLITISFVSSEMITLLAGIGIILGANVGTTTGAWLIAGLGLRVNIAAYAMPMLIFGVFFMMQKDRSLKGAGSLLMGAGFLFLGIHYMKEGFEAFQGSFDLSTYTVGGFPGVLLFALIGTLVTMIMQSSHATLLVIITALSAGQVSYENALALAIGANLGSAITTAAGGLAANLWGKRLAAAHLTFNLGCAILGILFIHQLGWLVTHLASLLGIAADDNLLKLALFHTLFNVLGVLLTLPLINQLEQALMRYISAPPAGTEQPIYLYPEALETPVTAVTAVRKEVLHLFDNAYGLLAHGLSLKRSTIESEEESLLDAVKNTRRMIKLDVEDLYEAKIKSLHSDIVAFIGAAQTRESTQAATEQLYVLRQASRDIVEAVKGMKHLHSNLSRLALSPNPEIRSFYDQIRLQLAKLLRDLRGSVKEQPGDVMALSLDEMKLAVEKSGRKLMDDLDEMIRYRRMAPGIATSIMNDENYAADISRSLLDAVQVLVRPLSSASVEPLSLDDKELQQLVDKAPDTPS